MPLIFPPFPGTILRCDFTNFKAPEMTKIRPVVLLSPKLQDAIRTTLLVIPLSTTEPSPAHNHHLKVCLPGEIIPVGLGGECWVKGDMVYSLSLDRLSFYHFERDKKTGKRNYYKDRFSSIDLFNIRKTVMYAIGLQEESKQ